MSKLRDGLAEEITRTSAEWDEPFTPEEANLLADVALDYVRKVLK